MGGTLLVLLSSTSKKYTLVVLAETGLERCLNVRVQQYPLGLIIGMVKEKRNGENTNSDLEKGLLK